MTSIQKLELNWIGKDQYEPIEPRVLVEDKAKSFGNIKSKKKSNEEDNLLIFGDNLLALKALESDYTNKIKCIYIDPPYNTGNAFKHYDDGLEHSIWLNLMSQRLEILYTLLKEDGSIWISIDADESHYLKVLCDEIFGRNNFVDEIVWQRAYSPINLKKTLSRNHDNILVYAKNKNLISFNKLDRSQDANSRYSNPDNDPRGDWMSDNLSVGPIIKEKVYEITTPSGRKVLPPKGYCWRLTKERFAEYLADNRIWFGKTGDNVPRIKRFLTEVKAGITPMTLWLRDEVGDNQEAKREVKVFNSKNVFETPKPERLIQKILHIATNEGDLVLDSFAGSGTTGAVAHKMNRKWIMVELGDHCHTHIIPRLKMVVDGTDQGGISKHVNWQGGGSFKYLKLAPSLLKKDKFNNWVINPNLQNEELIQALCKIKGYKYEPSKKEFWIHGKAGKSSYIYVTTDILTKNFVSFLSEKICSQKSLLVCCLGYRGSKDQGNLIIEKIPPELLKKHTWDKDDYSLNVSESPAYKAIVQQASKKTTKIQKRKKIEHPRLF